MKYVLLYILFINIIGFLAMGIYKYKAKKHLWRIPEKTLFALAVIGGSIGTTTGMHVFHHKTKHWYFLWGMPLILIVQAGLILYLELRH